MPTTNTSHAGADELRDRILDTALELAEEKGRWSAVRLHDVADRLSLSPAATLEHYRDLDAVADAWFMSGGGSRFACLNGSTRSPHTAR
jgi:AcrR family transcriptional regulator